MIARYLIEESIPYLKVSDHIEFALDLMQEYKVEHLPVIDGNQYLGTVSEQALFNCQDPSQQISTVHFRANTTHVYEQEHIFNVLNTLNEGEQTTLPVLNKQKEYLGAISMKSLLKGIMAFNMATEQGGILTLEVNVKEYALSEIARIIEVNNARILSVLTHQLEKTETMAVSIKINLIDLSHIIATFERYDYHVLQAFHQTEQMDYLKERYESFMHYLNI